MTKHKTTYTLLTFLISVSTLFCCTLPALITVLAGAAVVMSIFSEFPALLFFAKYHNWIFILAAILLAVNHYLLYFNKMTCPKDSGPYCRPTLRFAKSVYWISIVIYIIGFTSAYILPYILYGL